MTLQPSGFFFFFLKTSHKIKDVYHGNVQNTQVNVSKLSENHHLHKMQCAMYALLVRVYYSVLPARERTLFPIKTKTTATFPNLMLFTCTSCFQLPDSTCRTPSSCVEIGSCFRNNQESDLGLRQKAASVRSNNLASI